MTGRARACSRRPAVRPPGPTHGGPVACCAHLRSPTFRVHMRSGASVAGARGSAVGEGVGSLKQGAGLGKGL